MEVSVQDSGSAPRTAAPSSYFVPLISLAGLGITAFAATVAGSFTLAAFAGSALALLVGLRLWAVLGLARLSIEPNCSSERLFSGESLSLGLEIVNEKPLPASLSLWIGRSDALEPRSESETQDEVRLAPYGRSSGFWEFRAKKRGVYKLGPLIVSSSDPLGLAVRERVVPYDRPIIVYPRVLPLRYPALPWREFFGIHPARGIVEDPAWYEGTREYSGARPARYIHWKASARLDKLQEKIFQPTSHRKVFVVLDGSGFVREMDREGFESALEAAASLGAALAESGASLGLAVDRVVTGGAPFLPLGRGPEHLGAFLEILARCGFERGQSPAELIGRGGAQGANYLVVGRELRADDAGLASIRAASRRRLLFILARKPGSVADAPRKSGDESLVWIGFDELFERPEDLPPSMREGEA